MSNHKIADMSTQPAGDAMRSDIPAAVQTRFRADDEELRFIRSFHDVFLCIGILIFAIGLQLISGEIFSYLRASLLSSEPSQADGYLFLCIYLLNAGVFWLLAEYFARYKRRVLPSMILALFFVGSVSAIGVQLYQSLFLPSLDPFSGVDVFGTDVTDLWEASGRHVETSFLIFMISGVLAAGMFYLRMKLPFAMGLLGVGLAGTLIAALFILIGGEMFVRIYLYLLLVGGVLMFLLGIFYDARDPKRQTRYSDNGFWLHFFAGPVIFISVVSLTTGSVFAGGKGIVWAISTLAIVTGFALISLLINRRALLVSGLLSAGVAIAVLVSQTDFDFVWMAALTLLALGGGMLLLGAGWYPLRRRLVKRFPKSGLIARIIPPATIEE